MTRNVKQGVDRTLIGWREWVAFPTWGVEAVKAKVDTGARTSAMHAFDLESFERDGAPWVRFAVHPWQRSSEDEIVVEAARIDHRTITSSSGTRTDRPVVRSRIDIAGEAFDVELTLTRRDEMGFRLLIGREALRQRFVVDPARSYLGGKPSRAVRRRNRGGQ